MINTKFHKGFDEVLVQAYLFHDGYVKDEEAFTASSPIFTPSFAADFLSDIKTADLLPTNDDDLNKQVVLSMALEDAMEAGRGHFRKLMFYVNLAWPNDKAMANALGSSTYLNARKNTLRLINLLQNTYIDADSAEYKSSLIAVGFTQADIDLLNTLADDIRTKNHAKDQYMRQSNARSQARIKAFNKLWDTMVLISETSKMIFKDSPGHMKYYLLYPNSKSSSPKADEPPAEADT